MQFNNTGKSDTFPRNINGNSSFWIGKVRKSMALLLLNTQLEKIKIGANYDGV